MIERERKFLVATAPDGLRIVEVEFEEGDDPDAFDPPDWFGPEVTGDHRFTNAVLATAGRPVA